MLGSDKRAEVVSAEDFTDAVADPLCNDALSIVDAMNNDRYEDVMNFARVSLPDQGEPAEARMLWVDTLGEGRLIAHVFFAVNLSFDPRVFFFFFSFSPVGCGRRLKRTSEKALNIYIRGVSRRPPCRSASTCASSRRVAERARCWTFVCPSPLPPPPCRRRCRASPCRRSSSGQGVGPTRSVRSCVCDCLII